MAIISMSALLLATLLAGAVIASPYTADLTRVRRLAGGQEVNDDSFQSSFPFVVAIKIHNRLACGASIISSTQILTTASCSRIFKDQKDGSEATIAVGSSDLSQNIINITIKDIAVHPKYLNLQHDIAVVTFAPALTFSDKVKPALLPKTDVLENSLAKSVGWGLVKKVGPPSKILQMLDEKIISIAECKKLMPNPEKISAAYDICTIPKVGAEKAGTCNGDGGSPLVQGDTIVGMLSWGQTSQSREDCHSGYPDIFVNIFKYLDFINGKIILQ